MLPHFENLSNIFLVDLDLNYCPTLCDPRKRCSYKNLYWKIWKKTLSCWLWPWIDKNLAYNAWFSSCGITASNYPCRSVISFWEWTCTWGAAASREGHDCAWATHTSAVCLGWTSLRGVSKFSSSRPQLFCPHVSEFGSFILAVWVNTSRSINTFPKAYSPSPYLSCIAAQWWVSYFDFCFSSPPTWLRSLQFLLH